VIDLDIRQYFDSIPHSHLRAFLDQRVTDGVIRRMIDKWLKAGAVENGLLHRTTEGSPQGGVISPCLSNIFLHYVLDEWFEKEVRPRLAGIAPLSATPTMRCWRSAILLTPSVSGPCWASVLPGLGLRFIPTRHASSTSARGGQIQPAIRKRMEPRSTSLASPMFGGGHGEDATWFGKSRPKAALLARWLRRTTGAGRTGIGRSAISIAICPPCCGATMPTMALVATFDDCDGTPDRSCVGGKSSCLGEIAKAWSDGPASTKS
jgi:Reverse transcriptase (RNA-dependent DNA polymerase)